MTGRTADPIAELSTHLQPVAPLAIPTVRLRWWSLVAGPALIATIVVGVRRDWPTALTAWPVVGHTVVLALVAGVGAWAALRLAIPGEAQPKAAVWPVVLVALWLAWVGIELGLSSSSSAAWVVGFGWRCIVRAVVGAAVPGTVLLMMVRRAMPLFTRATAVALAASTAAMGELAAEWMCPNTWAMHLLAWHALPVIVVVVAATVFANALVGEIAPRPTSAAGEP